MVRVLFNNLIINKIILYIVFGFTLLVGVASIASADIQPWSIPTEVALKHMAISPQIEQGYEILEKVALCESNNIATAKNPKSSAKGRFQFLDSSWKYYGQKLWGDKWKEKNVLDYDDSTELAMYVYSINKLRDWEASKNCWSKNVPIDV